MGLKLLIKKANENYETASWAEKKSYYDAAVSRYYYCVYQKVIYISKKEMFYSRPSEVERAHIMVISEFIKNLKNKLESQDIITLKKMERLRIARNRSDYSEDKLGSKDFMLGFKFHFNEIIKIINKFL